MRTLFGLLRPKEFVYPVIAVHGKIKVSCRASACLIPDELSDKFGQLGAAIIDRSPVPTVLDIGTGSGIFLASLIMRSANPGRLKLHAIDIDRHVLPFARRNVARAIRRRKTKLSVSFRVQDMVTAEIEAGRKYALVFANLAYLMDDEPVRPEAATAPKHALYGGPDGMNQLRALLPHLEQLLLPGGVIIIRTPKERNRRKAFADLVRSFFPDPLISAIEATESYIAAVERSSAGDLAAARQLPELCEKMLAAFNPQVIPEISDAQITVNGGRSTTGILVWFRTQAHPLPDYHLCPESGQAQSTP